MMKKNNTDPKGKPASPPEAELGLLYGFLNSGRFDVVEKSALAMSNRFPHEGRIWHMLGYSRLALGKSEEAMPALERACGLLGNDAAVWKHLALCQGRLGCKEKAAESLERSLALVPGQPDALNNAAANAIELGRFQLAEQYCRRLLALRPDIAELHFNLGAALKGQRRDEEALAAFRRALDIAPNIPDAQNNIGLALQEMGLQAEAEACFRRAIALRPDHVEALNNLGNVFFDTCRYADAAAACEQALTLRPDMAETLTNLGNAQRKLGRLDDASASYRRALALRPDLAEAHANYAELLRERHDIRGAAEHFASAVALQPDACLMLDAANAQMSIADWQAAEPNRLGTLAALRGGLRAGDRPHPFLFLALDGATPQDQLTCARQHAAQYAKRLPVRAERAAAGRDGVLRIGYLSDDFHAHAIAYLVTEVIECHDRNRFEIVAYDHSPSSDSPYRKRLEKAFDCLVRIDSLSDQDVAKRMAEDRIDIAVDLKGWTYNTRGQILAHRPAPLQVQWLGYPGTLGADWIDYILADPWLVRRGEEVFYSEKVVRLPDTYQSNDRRKEIGPTPGRRRLGLPESGLVFCCFNQTYKITPPMFGAWMALLRETEGSVLWLLEDNATAPEALRRQAALRGIDPERLVFAPKCPLPEHLGRMRQADLALDCFPYTSHTTGSDALWAGVPLLALSGDTFAARVSGSLLRAVGLPELITQSLDDYLALALQLAREPALLGAYRERLAKNRMNAPLFDSTRFTRHLEAAYLAMWKRHCAGLPPDHFDIPAEGDWTDER
jgi:predicted O-linked N-acetylglucosamine transferase (SPINDLY family)